MEEDDVPGPDLYNFYLDSKFNSALESQLEEISHVFELAEN